MGRKIVLIATLLLALNSLAAQALKEPKLTQQIFVPAFDIGETVVTGAPQQMVLVPRGFSGMRAREIYVIATGGTGVFDFAIKTTGPSGGAGRTIATGQIIATGHYAVTILSDTFISNDYAIFIEITSVTTPGLTGLSGVIKF